MLFDNKVERSPVPEAKSFYQGFDLSFAEFLSSNGYHDLSALTLIQMYKDCIPFFIAVDMRATHVASIPVRLWDKSKEEFVDDHEALDLLQKPNGDMTYNEFMYAISSYYDITGNCFLYAGGRIERPPLELTTIAPYNVTFPFGGQRFGILNIPNRIQYNSYTGGHHAYDSEEDKRTGLIRFISTDGLRDRELWHIRSFNPTRSNNCFWGMSKSQPAWIEMQQFLSGNKTNWSMLKRGTRITMAWVNNRTEELTENQWNRLKEEAQKYAGDENAGGSPLLDGVDVKPIQSTFKEMEFEKLQRNMYDRVMAGYQIPLPLVSSATMTLDNLKTSMLQLYDRAVIPSFKYLASELSRFILPRFEGTENLVYSYSEKDITALVARNIEMALSKSKVGVNTIDELRADIGDKPLESGEGNVVYRPISEVPIGGDSSFEPGDISDPPNPPPDPDDEDEDE